MATATSAESASRNYAAQAALLVALEQALARAWALVDVRSLRATLPDFTDAAKALVAHYSAASVSLAVTHYEDMRRHAGVRSPFRTPLVGGPSDEDIMRDLTWSTNDLWGKASLTDPAVSESGLSKAQGSLGRLVLNSGRDQIITASERDRAATAWAREARPDACWFCAMLATRGAVYDSAGTAGQVKASASRDEGGLGIGDAKGFVNRYHRNCKCQVVPVFHVYEQTAQARQWKDLWYAATSHVSGQDAKQAAFRAAFEAEQAH